MTHSPTDPRFDATRASSSENDSQTGSPATHPQPARQAFPEPNSFTDPHTLSKPNSSPEPNSVADSNASIGPAHVSARDREPLLAERLTVVPGIPTAELASASPQRSAADGRVAEPRVTEPRVTEPRVTEPLAPLRPTLARPPEILAAESVQQRSWIFRGTDALARGFEWCLGVVAILVVLAMISAIPILQLLTLGYLLESARRVTQTGRFWAGAVGLRKAARIGSVLLGTFLCLLPVQYASSLWYAAYLLDAESETTHFLRLVQLTLTVLIVPHIVAAWYCGGRLRNFLWPLLAPLTLSLWCLRRAAGSPSLRPLLNRTLGWLSPRLVEDLCRARPLSDWFLPAVVVRQVLYGRLLGSARDQLWDFAHGLRLPHYFLLGLRGLVGSYLWLAIPLIMLVSVTSAPNELAVLLGIAGAVCMSVVLLYVPFAQAQFAHQNRWRAFWDVRSLRQAFRGAPVLHLLSLLLLLTASLPLYVFKIETIPVELIWLPAVVFLALTWPTRAFVAYAYARGIRRERRRGRWLTWPVRGLQWPLALTYTTFVFVSQYVAWNGSLSLLEQHVVLIPAPFLRLPF